MQVQERINKMVDGDIKEIEYGLKSDIPILVINAIMCGINNHAFYNGFNEDLKKKKFYNDSVISIPFSCVYDSALDILGIEKYNGNDETVRFFIEKGSYF